jgi:predicted DCC family thiol-disulfide oxidoreductase YuxK
MTRPLDQADQLTLYYDGSCPLCLAEMEYLKSRDDHSRLCFEDITRSQFDAAQHGIDCAGAMQSIVGKLSSGAQMQGVAVFAAAYERVGLYRLAWLLSRESLQKPLGFMYLQFAKHRHSISKWFGPLALKLSRRVTGTKGQL